MDTSAIADTTLTESWRSTTSGYTDRGCSGCGDATGCVRNGIGCQFLGGSGVHGDHDTWIEGWYRFSGDGGDALPLAPPGGNRCGFGATGWLAGCDGTNTTCSALGMYPSVKQAMTKATVCFKNGESDPCYYHTKVSVVSCRYHHFMMLQLPSFPDRWRLQVSSSMLR